MNKQPETLTETERAALVEAAHPSRPDRDELLIAAAERILDAHLEGALSDRDEQEARAMRISASADEWWGLYDQELRRADALAARLAPVEAVIEGYHDATLQPGEFVARLRAALEFPAAVRDGSTLAPLAPPNP